MGKLVVKDNAFLEAGHKLNEVEQQLVLLAIVKAREFCDSVEQLRGKSYLFIQMTIFKLLIPAETWHTKILKKQSLACMKQNGATATQITRVM